MSPLPMSPFSKDTEENGNKGEGLPAFTAPVASDEPSVFDENTGVVPTRPAGGNVTGNTGGIPVAPVTAGPRGGYQSVGNLTAADVLDNNFSRWAYLEERIEEIEDWVQETLSRINQTDKVSEARQERGEKYEEMIKTLDRMILTHIANMKDIANVDKPYVVARVTNEILGLGPLEPLWRDKGITEIIADGPYKIRIEKNGKLRDVPGARFRDSDHLLHMCQQILAPLNRSLDVATPLADGRLPDKSRVNAVHPAIAPGGPFLTIRRHREEAWTIKELVERNSMTEEVAKEIGYLVHSGCSTIVIGGTGTGKMLSHDTILPTPFGFTTMGEVKVGDKVLDENGKPTTVTAKYSLKDPVPYRVVFSDGTSVLADEDHNWFTSTRAARRSDALAKKTETARVRAARMTDAELEVLRVKHRAALEDDFLSRRDVLDLFPNHTSMLSSFFSSHKDVLDVRQGTGETAPGKDRYRYPARALWSILIEHCSAFVRDQRHKRAVESIVTTKEILQTLKTSTGHTNHAVAVVDSVIDYPERSLEMEPYLAGSEAARVAATDSRLSKFFTDKSGELNVPDDYRFSSESHRRAFLAGFLDEIGSVAKRSATVKVSHKSATLLRGISSVISSLGMKTLFAAGEDGKVSKLSFRPDDNPFRDEAKRTQYENAVTVAPKNGGRDNWRYIVDVQPYEGKVEMSCITVDSPNSLYLCSDQFIITHNTTVLNAISGLIPEDERVVTIEDNLELQLHPDRMVASLEARPAGANQRGAITIRDLVRNALRMRPDRIVVGEVRDAAAFDMLQAMNTGHDGSLTTFHANGAEEAIPRLESMVQMAGELDPKGVKALIAGAVDIIVVASRYEDGSRRVSGVYEIPSRIEVDSTNSIVLHPIPLWEFIHDETTSEGKVIGHYERINEVSEGLIRKHRLHRRPRLSIEEVYEIGRLHSDDDEEENF